MKSEGALNSTHFRSWPEHFSIRSHPYWSDHAAGGCGLPLWWFYGTLPWSVVSVKSLIKTSLWCLYLQQTNVCVCVRETSHSQCACVCLEHRSAPDPMETSIWGDLCPRVPIWREFQEHSNLRLMLRYMECVRLRDNKYQCERTLSVMGFRSLVSSLGMCLQYSSDNKYIRIHIYTVYIYIYIYIYITINRIQNKSFCLHNIGVYCAYLWCIYKYTQYTFQKNMLCSYIKYIYI